ncbi:MAG: CapA family protein, partial [Nitrospinota bacterium]
MSTTAHIAFVGDVYVERSDGYAAAAAMQHVAPFLQKHFDLRCANLEAPLSERGRLKRSFPWASLRAKPHNVEVLVGGGFDIVTLANNHTMDYGPEALLDTIRLLEERGIGYVGGGVNWERAWTMQTREIKGIRVGFLGIEATAWTWIEHDATPDTPGIAALFISPYFPGHVDGYRLEYALGMVEHFRPHVDLLTVNIHWGHSVSHQVCTYQREVGRKLIDYGADVVIGHHPHTIQGVEVYRHRPIIYSLGNFLFDSLRLPPEGMLLGCSFSQRRMERIWLRPTCQRNG